MNRTVKRLMQAALLAAALAADSIVSVRLAAGNEAVTAAALPGEADPLYAFRLEREQLRAREEAQLNQIIYAAGAEEDAALARRRLMDMLARAEAETTLEGVLAARGFDGAVVTVSDSAANVLVRREQPLTQRESAVILELVTRETGLGGGNVKIIPVK